MRGGVVRSEGGGLFVLGFGTGPVPVDRELDKRERCVGFCERRIKCQGFDGSFPGFWRGFVAWQYAGKGQLEEGVRDAGIGEREFGIFSDGLLEVVESFSRTFPGPQTPQTEPV